ncbi:MAG: FtsX-like permease family protein [Planctomycetes bacterium]|nr:FtsX-like permease family protein [Planctomycetota bacterium]
MAASMQHWWQLATRNWRAKPGRCVAAVVSIALGVATVVTITCFYESVRLAVADRVVGHWLGRAHLTVEHYMGHWGIVDQSLVGELEQIDNVQNVAARLRRRMSLHPPIASADVSSAESEPRPIVVDAVGIDAATEYAFRPYDDLDGRRFAIGESGVALVEADLVADWGESHDGSVVLSKTVTTSTQSFKVVGTFPSRRLAKFQNPVVILPLEDLQELRSEPNVVSSVDIMLANPSAEELSAATKRIESLLRSRGLPYHVTSAEAKLEQLHEAEHVTHLILLLVAVVAMMTSFFIILTTMGMGIVERIATLGAMRCLGVTRRQLTMLVLLEVAPLGLMGIALGIPLGAAVTYLGAALVPEYVQGVTLSRWGIKLAAAGGAITTLLVAAILIWRVCRVSPLAAARPQSKPTSVVLTVLAAFVGVGLIAAHEWLIAAIPATWWFHPVMALAGLATVYGGYVLLAPLLVATVGTVCVAVVAVPMRLPGPLARDQIGKAHWRGAGVAWMLMVGLSLIVYIAVRSESVMAAWDFPSHLPETFVWSPNPVSPELGERIEALPGVKKATVVCDIPCRIGSAPEPVESPSLLDRMRGALRSKLTPNTFVAGDAEVFLSMAKLGFLQGDLDEVRDKLYAGGYVLLPAQAARALGLGIGDQVEIHIGERSAQFEVAGVVQSPALDIAVTYFEAESYLMVAAAGAVLGTLDDARKHFGIDQVTMFMMNVTIEDQPIPEEFKAETAPKVEDRLIARSLMKWRSSMPNEAEPLARLIPKLEPWLASQSVEPVSNRSAPGATGGLPTSAGRGSVLLSPDDRSELRLYSPGATGGLSTSAGGGSVLLSPDDRSELRLYSQAFRDVAVQWPALSPLHRWEAFREQIVLRRVARIMDRPDAVMASVRRLKAGIMQDIRKAIVLLNIMPAVALAVAALGVANLMTVNVTSRTREIAVMRAVGATKSQIVRLVLTEAMSLGTVGCILGVVLGMHTARSMNRLTTQLVGFEPMYTVPWMHVGVGVVFTFLICLIAGIAPARHAARNNIIAAIQSA